MGEGRARAIREDKVLTRIASATREVVIAYDWPTVLIGERINPTANKKLAEALKAGSFEVVRQEGLAQVQAGADVIDVNVGGFGIDEVSALPRAVEVLMEAVDVPLCIDSASPAAMEAALKIYKGKPLVNSVTGEESSIARILPLVKKYGAAVVGLVQDGAGIPTDSERRVAIARRLVQQVEAAGIPREDLIIDCLACSLGADPASAAKVLTAIARIRAELGLNQTLGASNVSFGLPDRETLNNAFIPLAISAGATCLIANASKSGPAIRAVDLVLGRDSMARRYIGGYRRQLQLKKEGPH
ncbi:MAG: dihydropteroate synthase [Chloroflexi bacterium]|nr:dihydropteroate synthase [Chloroflexota bacterium]